MKAKDETCSRVLPMISWIVRTVVVASLLSLNAYAEAPVRGSADAEVTLLIFSAFTCPYCAETSKQISKLEEHYGDRVRFVFRHFPLGDDDASMLPHELAIAAGEQDRFWKAHDWLFQHQGRVSRASLPATAKALGLDVRRLSDSLGKRSHKAQIQTDIAEAMALNVKATPTIFVAGLRFEGQQEMQSLEQVIDFKLGISGRQTEPRSIMRVIQDARMNTETNAMARIQGPEKAK